VERVTVEVGKMTDEMESITVEVGKMTDEMESINEVGKTTD